MNRLITAIIALGLLAFGGYLAFGGQTARPPDSRPVATAVAAQPPIGQVLAEGRVVPSASVALNFQHSGLVAEILVAEGDSVTKGTPLARLDTHELELQRARAAAEQARAQAAYQQLIEQAAPAEVAALEAQLAQAEANLRQTRGSVTPQDIAAARATLSQAMALLARLEAGPRSAAVQQAEAELAQAQANLQTQRDGRSAAKTTAELQMQQATTELTRAQAAYATAKRNWEYVEDTGNDPLNPKLVSATGKITDNKLNDTQRQRYRDALTEAEAAMQSAASAVQQARIAYDNARQAEVSGIQGAEAQLQRAQAALDLQRTAADPDQIAAARAQVAQARANLDKLLGDQRAGGVDAAAAGVASAEANLARIRAGPSAAAVAVAKAQLALADIDAQQAQLALDRATLVAPADGTVARINLTVGEAPAPATAIVLLATTSVWQVETTDLTELDIGKIGVGDPATLTFEALPDVRLTGKVTKIALVGQTRQGDITYAVTIVPDAPEQRLRWNMTASVAIGAR